VVASEAGTVLLERVLAGDATAMEGLIDAAWPRLGRGWLRVDAAELRQEAVAELLAAAREHALMSDPRDPAVPGASPADDHFARAAIARLKRRLAAVVRAERTRSSRLRPLGPADEERAVYEPSSRVAEQVESPTLGRALARLSPRERAVIARTYWREMTAAEIAEGEGLDPETVRQIRRRAETVLREALGGKRPGRR
jgi:RNA polymerase sigma factor (sigma-70 family)